MIGFLRTLIVTTISLIIVRFFLPILFLGAIIYLIYIFLMKNSRSDEKDSKDASYNKIYKEYIKGENTNKNHNNKTKEDASENIIVLDDDDYEIKK